MLPSKARRPKGFGEEHICFSPELFLLYRKKHLDFCYITRLSFLRQYGLQSKPVQVEKLLFLYNKISA